MAIPAEKLNMVVHMTVQSDCGKARMETSPFEGPMGSAFTLVLRNSRITWMTDILCYPLSESAAKVDVKLECGFGFKHGSHRDDQYAGIVMFHDVVRSREAGYTVHTPFPGGFGAAQSFAHRFMLLMKDGVGAAEEFWKAASAHLATNMRITDDAFDERVELMREIAEHIPGTEERESILEMLNGSKDSIGRMNLYRTVLQVAKAMRIASSRELDLQGYRNKAREMANQLDAYRSWFVQNVEMHRNQLNGILRDAEWMQEEFRNPTKRTKDGRQRMRNAPTTILDPVIQFFSQQFPQPWSEPMAAVTEQVKVMRRLLAASDPNRSQSAMTDLQKSLTRNLQVIDLFVTKLLLRISLDRVRIHVSAICDDRVSDGEVRASIHFLTEAILECQKECARLLATATSMDKTDRGSLSMVVRIFLGKAETFVGHRDIHIATELTSTLDRLSAPRRIIG